MTIVQVDVCKNFFEICFQKTIHPDKQQRQSAFITLQQSLIKKSQHRLSDRNENNQLAFITLQRGLIKKYRKI